MTAAAPYPGLRPFRPDEVDVFFGREEQIDRVVNTTQLANTGVPGQLVGTQSPRFLFRDSGFWMQGFNLALEWQY